VLAAMGVPRELAICAIRFSLGRTTTEEDVARALAIVDESVRAARRVTAVAT
jgi:cysteine sulfinate desulfinase/cysteine desulfurase-like protein